MKINLIANELKKIYKLRYVAVAASVFLLFGYFFVFQGADSTIKKFDTENYPENITYENGVYSVELKFKDMILAKYGNTIDTNELPLVKEELQRFEKQVKEAERNDEILKRAGFNPDFGAFERNHELSDEDQQYVWEYSNGTLRFEGTDYPVYFLDGFQEIVDYMESMAERGENPVYHVLSDSFGYAIGNELSIIVIAAAASLFMIIPYMVNENKSKIALFEYSSKTGRKSYANKLIAVIITLFITIGTSAGMAAAYFRLWDISRYYDCKIDTMMITSHVYLRDLEYADLPGIYSKCYTGLTFLELYVLLLLGLSLCGILTVFLASIIAYRFDNIFAPFSIGLLLLSLPIIFNERFVSYVIHVNNYDDFLTTKYEPLIFLGVLLFAAVFVAFMANRERKKEEI